MQCHVVVVGAKIVVSAAAGAFTFEGFVAAYDAIAVLHLVGSKARADSAALGDGHLNLLMISSARGWGQGQGARG